MNVNLKLSGLYSSLFVIRFSLIFQKKFGGGGENRKEPKTIDVVKYWQSDALKGYGQPRSTSL